MKKFSRLIYVFLIISSASGQWVQTNVACSDTVLCLTVTGSDLFAGTLFGGVFRSTNNGTSWIEVNNGLSNYDIMSLAVSGTDVFAATWGNGVFRSTNNGTNWSEIGLPSTYVQALAIIDTNIFAGTNDGVFITTDNGISWSAINNGLTNRGILTLTVSGTNLIAGTSDGVFFTTNNGISWSKVVTGLTNTFVLTLVGSGTNLYAGTFGSGVFLTTNSGTNWSAVNTGIENTMVRALADSGTKLFAGTSEGIFITINNGTSWSPVSTGLMNTDIKTLIISGTDLFAGTWGDGVWRRPISDMITSVESLQTYSPTSYILMQNHPNPFNPNTTIRFSIAEQSNVKLKIFNAIGHEVSTVVNTELVAGNHSIDFNAASLSSGVYFYRIETPNFTSTKKMILMK